MKENLRQTGQDFKAPSRKEAIVTALKSEKGEIRVGEAGGLAFIAGIILVSEGANRNSVPEMAIGAGISAAVLLEAIVTSFRKPR
jgi:hypothetical protein